MTNFLQEWGERVDRLGPALQHAGNRADGYACEIIELLKDLNSGVSNLYPGVDSYEYPRLPIVAAGGAKEVPGREGYLKVIKTVAVVGAAAVDVDIFLLTADASGFVRRVTLGAAGRTSADVNIPVPEGASFYVTASADAQVNLVVQRISL